MRCNVMFKQDQHAQRKPLYLCMTGLSPF